MNNTQQTLADILQKELDNSTFASKSGIPHKLSTELLEWGKVHDIEILALESLEDILKNYF